MTRLGFTFKERSMAIGFNVTNDQQQNTSYLKRTNFQKGSRADFQASSTYSYS